MKTINETQVQRYKATPKQLMMGITATGPLDVIWNATSRRLNQIDTKSKSYQYHLAELQKSLLYMHRIASEQSAQIQNQRNKLRAKKHGVDVANYTLGDYVLRARVNKGDTRLDKLSCVWLGPYRVTKIINDYAYELEDLLTGHRKITHAARMRRYFDSSLNVTEDLLRQVRYAKTSYQYEELADHRYNKDTKAYEFLVKWLGFSKKENTWEPLINCYEDYPELLTNYIKKQQDRERIKLETVVNSITNATVNPPRPLEKTQDQVTTPYIATTTSDVSNVAKSSLMQPSTSRTNIKTKFKPQDQQIKKYVPKIIQGTNRTKVDDSPSPGRRYAFRPRRLNASG